MMPTVQPSSDSQNLPLKDIRELAARLALNARRDILATRGGTRTTNAKGKGLDFSELREYQPSDDARNILWQSVASRGPVKYRLYHEEHDIADLIAVDISRSMTVFPQKWSLALQTAAIPLAVATLCGNGASLVTFSDCTHSFTRLATGTRPLTLAMRLLLDAPATAHDATDITACLEAIQNSLKKPTRISLISDLADNGFIPRLARLARTHDITVCHIAPSILDEIPCNNAELEDAETRQRLAVTPQHRKAIQIKEQNALASIRQAVIAAKAHYILLDGTSTPLQAFKDSLA